LRRKRAAVSTAAFIAALILGAAPAAATVTGPCDGSAEWQDVDPALEVVAGDVEAGEVVIIPLDATVRWMGAVDIPEPPSPRDTSGTVEVELPFPFGFVQVGTWSTSGTQIDNSGTYTYDFPAILSGFEVTVQGKHWEGTLTRSGDPTCSGTVTLALEGTNPIGFIAGGLTLVSIMGAYLAIRVKGPAAGGSL
jgi:hypothetical protein